MHVGEQEVGEWWVLLRLVKSSSRPLDFTKPVMQGFNPRLLQGKVGGLLGLAVRAAKISPGQLVVHRVADGKQLAVGYSWPLKRPELRSTSV